MANKCPLGDRCRCYPRQERQSEIEYIATIKRDENGDIACQNILLTEKSKEPVLV